MIDLNTVVQAHGILIDQFGGSKGVRDSGALEAAFYRPFASFDQQDLYPTAIEKAAATFESLIINHPFIDGNKRIAYLMLELYLAEDDYTIDATQADKYSMTITASTGELNFEGIVNWIRSRIQKIQ